MNRDFAKIVDGRVQFADDYVCLYITVTPEEGEPFEQLMRYSHPTAAQYAEAGYLPVVTSEKPEDGDGYYYVAGYELVDGHIEQVWERREVEPEPPSIEDGMRYLTGGM